MANKIIVGTIRRVSGTPVGLDAVEDIDVAHVGHPTCELDDGQTVSWGPDESGGNAYGETLRELQTLGAHAYVEIDSETNAIQKLLIPHEGEVADLNWLPGGEVEVDLAPSSAKHLLRADNPSYGQFVEVLRKALTEGGTVLITEHPDSHDIIDVRNALGGEQEPNPPLPAAPEVAPAEFEAFLLSVTPSISLAPVTQERANELFDLARAESCLPDAISVPCIPFLYPDDGCWARAQRVCDVFSGLGEDPGKIWNYGDLKVKTQNNPLCKVSWVYHVAPILRVANAGSAEDQVIDPCLFSEPVPISTWTHKQGDPAATQATTDATVFYRSSKGKLQFDPTGSKTIKELRLVRLRFKLRCASSAGPPPYSQCP